MKRALLLLSLALVGGCGKEKPVDQDQEDARQTLPEARRGFQTQLLREESGDEKPPRPPPSLFRLVRYDSPAGRLAAYVGQAPRDGKKRPAIVWLFGGFDSSISEVAWQRYPAKNDQSASPYRQAGIVMMYPSLRGGNDNPGHKEGFYGEVDDVLAAADFLAKQEGVDPDRIYLGGHSTGGTLALLVAASTDRFRAVFSFGPVHDIAGYDPNDLPFDVFRTREVQLRSPGRWLHSIRCPTFVFEGTEGDNNLVALQSMQQSSTNALVRFHPVEGADHFSLLAPLNRLIAVRILKDDGATTNIAFTEGELGSLVRP